MQGKFYLSTFQSILIKTLALSYKNEVELRASDYPHLIKHGRKIINI